MTPEREIYTSFHEIPPRDYMYFPKGTIEPSKPGNFSKTEIIHIFVSMFVLIIAFAFALTDNSLIERFANFDALPFGLVLSFFGIATAFFFHEMSHKFMAQKYGLWAEYRMFPMGLLLAFILGVFTGFVFAAPGAVMFRGQSRVFETGRIAMAGPLANIVIASITLPVYVVFLYEIEPFNVIVGFICVINAFLATFNLIPIGILDGVKIIRWNVNVWIAMLIISACLTVVSMQLIISSIAG